MHSSTHSKGRDQTKLSGQFHGQQTLRHGSSTWDSVERRPDMPKDPSGKLVGEKHQSQACVYLVITPVDFLLVHILITTDLNFCTIPVQLYCLLSFRTKSNTVSCKISIWEYRCPFGSYPTSSGRSKSYHDFISHWIHSLQHTLPFNATGRCFNIYRASLDICFCSPNCELHISSTYIQRQFIPHRNHTEF
jgi:hypothetical protein